MHFTPRLSVNSLFWLTSLRDDEKGVTRRVWEDLPGVFAVEGLPAEMIEITSAIELHSALTELVRLANLGAKLTQPILAPPRRGGDGRWGRSCPVAYTGLHARSQNRVMLNLNFVAERR